MINRTFSFDISCRRHTAAGQLRATAPKTPDLPLHSIGKGIKIRAGERNDSAFVTHNALTVRHLDPSERLNTHSSRLLIANRHRLRGFLL